MSERQHAEYGCAAGHRHRTFLAAAACDEGGGNIAPPPARYADTARVERRCIWCGAYPIFVAMHGHRCPTTGRFERFEMRLIDGNESARYLPGGDEGDCRGLAT